MLEHACKAFLGKQGDCLPLVSKDWKLGWRVQAQPVQQSRAAALASRSDKACSLPLPARNSSSQVKSKR